MKQIKKQIQNADDKTSKSLSFLEILWSIWTAITQSKNDVHALAKYRVATN